MNTVQLAEHRILDALVRSESDRRGCPVESTVLRERAHRGSMNLEVALDSGTERRALFVKWLSDEADHRFQRQSAGQERPRLKPFPDPSTKLIHEEATLEAIGRMVHADGRPGWFPIPVVELLFDGSVLCLERIPLPTFAELESRARDRERLRRSANHLGTWLEAFHRLPPLPHTRDHLESRDAVAALLSGLEAHLEHRPSGEVDSRLVARAVAATEALPPVLPLVLGHGDFAAQNVLVGGGDEIGVFDSSGDWRMPPHVDLAYFNVMLELAGMKRLLPFGRGRSDEAAIAAEVRAGYGPAAPPRAELAVFELVVLLDKWATLSSAPPRRGPASLRQRLRRDILLRRLHGAVLRRLGEVHGGG